MASYEVEHNTENLTNESSQPRPRRPDLSTFFATLSEITPNPAETRTRPHAVPVPADVSAAFRTLAEALNVIRRDNEGGGGGGGGDGEDGDGDGVSTSRDDSQQQQQPGSGLLDQMIEALLQGADIPPREVEGVDDEFCDSLDRIPKSTLQPSQSCPICNNPFLEDPYPLVVRLPCHPAHLFDLECVRPWLRLRGTCPLDRVDFAEKLRKKELDRRMQAQKRAAGRGGAAAGGSGGGGGNEDDEDEEWDGMYA